MPGITTSDMSRSGVLDRAAFNASSGEVKKFAENPCSRNMAAMVDATTGSSSTTKMCGTEGENTYVLSSAFSVNSRHHMGKSPWLLRPRGSAGQLFMDHVVADLVRSRSSALAAWAAALLSLAQAFVYAGVLDLLFPLVPSTSAPLFFVLSQILRVTFNLLLGWMVFRGIRKLGLEGWLLLPPIVLLWGDWLASQLTFLQIPRLFSPFGVTLTLTQIIGFLPALSMCVLLVRRWVRSAQAQQKMTLEMKQAQEVQQVLIPEAVPEIPGFSIQSIYQPAGQVGGDFFQILPAQRGAVLVCIGDVSGKGMPAAMTVSLLVGTLRTLAHYTQSPGEILAAMNRRMMGRSRGGFTTCLVLLAASDGTVTVANAGHISPYLSGRGLPLDNGLPLGLVAESAYTESTFHQEENEQITLVTDGVVEARAASGELFGFERTAAIAGEAADSISWTAREFGQDDDITVLTLTRLAIGKQSSAQQALPVVAPSMI
jgi:hypothetical protein